MRVAYISHSLIAERQKYFADELRKQLQAIGGELFELYPSKWGRHERAGGHIVHFEGDQSQYTFPTTAWQQLRDWKPDVVLLQQEPYCIVSYQVQKFCQRLGVQYVIFTWENLTQPSGAGLEVLRNAAGVVCGNTDAIKLCESVLPDYKGVVEKLPQVGVNPNIFYPVPADKIYDVIFMGRKSDSMKGESVLDEATKNKPWRVAKGYELGFADYNDLAARYCSAKIHCVPSMDFPGRPREQFAPYATIESLFCEVPVVTTNQAAIQEWTQGCPGVWRADQGNARMLEMTLAGALKSTDEGIQRRGRRGREWALTHFTNEVVAKAYVEVLTRCMKP